MKNQKSIRVLTIIIVALSIMVCSIGLYSKGTGSITEFRSIYGQDIDIYGEGIYKHDSVTLVAQGKAQDAVTLFVAVPALIILMFLSKRNSMKIWIMYTGVMGYFLYSFISYVFLWSLNYLFIPYVTLMSLCFFTFILLITGLKPEEIKQSFTEKTPVKLFGIFQIVMSMALFLMWVGEIMPTFAGSAPAVLEHYTTLVIQGLDLGFIVPVSFLSGIWILKRKPIGYMLTSVMMVKALALLMAIDAMIINQYLYGVHMNTIQIFVFGVASLFVLIIQFKLFRNVKS